MAKISFITIWSVLLFISCGNDKKPSEGGSFSKQADQIESENNLSAACEKDLKKFGEFLDDAKVMIKKHADGQKMSEADKNEWNKKSQDMAKEFASSAMAFTDVDCSLAITKMQMEFGQVMMQMAQARMQ